MRIIVAHSLMLRCRGFSRASRESLFLPAAFPGGGGRALFRARAQRLGKERPGPCFLRQRVKAQRLPGFRVAEEERAGEERQRAAAVLRAVFPVPDEREPARGELHPDLVRAPGLEPHAQKAQSLAVREALIVQQRLLYAPAGAGDDVGLVFRPLVKEQVVQRAAQAPVGPLTICYQGLPLGPAKNLGKRCNNLYPKAKRIRMDIR